MFVRFLCNWPPYKDGQRLEIPDRIGADFVARAMAEVVPAVDRAIDKRINAMPARGGRREITEDEWRRSLGQKGPAPYRHLPAEITVRG
jgi:hypothetical protein